MVAEAKKCLKKVVVTEPELCYRSSMTRTCNYLLNLVRIPIMGHHKGIRRCLVIWSLKFVCKRKRKKESKIGQMFKSLERCHLCNINTTYAEFKISIANQAIETALPHTSLLYLYMLEMHLSLCVDFLHLLFSNKK